MNRKQLSVLYRILMGILLLLIDNSMTLSIEHPKNLVPDAIEKAETYEGMEWKGHISDQKEKLIKVVVDKKEWDELWMRAFPKPAPELDFEKYAVACIFLGHDADWLYSIWFDKPYEHDKMLVIPFNLAEIILELSGPFKASGQYYMKVFKKQKGVEMIIENSSRYSKRK